MRAPRLTALLICLLPTLSAGAAPLYHATDLGFLPGSTYSFASGINDSNQIVGRCDDADGKFEHAFLYSNGKMSDLGTLPGDVSSAANGINNHGQIVGVSFDGTSGHAFLYSNGTMQNIGVLPAQASSQAFGINGSGQVIGVSGGKGFLYDGTMHDLGAREALAINNVGQITGEGAYLYDGGVVTHTASSPCGISAFSPVLSRFPCVCKIHSSPTCRGFSPQEKYA